MSRKEALHRINECKKQRSTYLDLSGLRLKAIPVEVSELVWLHHIDFSINRIQKIEHLDSLAELRSLDFTAN
ncbi:MAG: hypothetical protein RL180_744, partial [Pseudomonadota bacterium]